MREELEMIKNVNYIMSISRSNKHYYLLLLLLLTAIKLSHGGSSLYTSTDKTNKNKYT